MMQEIMILVLEVILLILKMRCSAEDATRETSEKYGVPFSKLWEAVPKHWK
ncbi:hypothetical protein [Clostridium sp.]|uniref:hypothetical protein n=1 Tax=Clostridium sp. TaxID=1506 RepID=UPI0026346EA1|nr:hypothetical protein [Clostridium sp.]